MIQDYFSNRVLLYDTNEGTNKYIVTACVPQESVLGSLLYNVIHSEVLKLELPENYRIGFDYE